MQFVTKGYQGETLGCSLSYIKLEIRGNWHLQGRQAKEDIPKEIIDLFDKDSGIEQIAISKKNNGLVYSR
jgi:hypothetical protein